MSVEIKLHSAGQVVPSEMISWVEFMDLTSVHPTRLGDLIELGWLEPTKTSGEQFLFCVRDVYRVRKLERICNDFELSSLGGTIIVDLLCRIEALEQKVRELERR